MMCEGFVREKKISKRRFWGERNAADGGDDRMETLPLREVKQIYILFTAKHCERVC